MKESEKEYRKRYYLKNRKKLLKKFKENYQKNKKEILLKRKKRYKAERDLMRERARNFRRKNEKYYLERHKNYYNLNKKIILKQRKKYQKNYPERINTIYPSSQISIPKNQLCQICHKYPAKVRHHFNYSKPLKVNLLCKSCHKIIHFKNVK